MGELPQPFGVTVGPILVGRKLICGVAVPAECHWNCLDGDGPQVAYVVSNGGLEFRQDEVEFSLALGSDGLSAKVLNSFF